MGITSIRLTEDLDQPLDVLAKKLDRSKNYLINQAIKEFLAKQSLEDSRLQGILAALESIKAGESLDDLQGVVEFVENKTPLCCPLCAVLVYYGRSYLRAKSLA